MGGVRESSWELSSGPRGLWGGGKGRASGGALGWFGHMPADKACECLRKYHRVAVSSAPERSWEGAGGCRSPQVGGTCRKAKPLLRNQKCVSFLSSRLPRDSAQGRATCAGQIHHSSYPWDQERQCCAVVLLDHLILLTLATWVHSARRGFCLS